MVCYPYSHRLSTSLEPKKRVPFKKKPGKINTGSPTIKSIGDKRSSQDGVLFRDGFCQQIKFKYF